MWSYIGANKQCSVCASGYSKVFDSNTNTIVCVDPGVSDGENTFCADLEI